MYMKVYIYDPVFRPRGPPPSPPEWDGSPGSTPTSFYLQAIGSISEVQPLGFCSDSDYQPPVY